MKNINNKSPLRECIEFIESYKKDYLEGDKPFILGPDEKAFEITNESIFQIPDCKDFRKIGFVDGGNASLINSSDFNISLNRVAGASFYSNKIIPLSKMPELIEFYSATVIIPIDDGSMEFITRFFPRDEDYRKYMPLNDINIKYNDPSILSGRGFLPKIERFGAIARRFAEWRYATEFVENELDRGDIFVRDGSLQTGFTGEIELARELYVTALLKKVYVTGLSKTCRLFTKNGDSLISVINSIANNIFPNEKWYYHPIYQFTKADNQADLFFIKLNKDSYYPFRFDIYIEQSKKLKLEETEIIISNIANNSTDLSFPGYPYGLIKVDQMSRVSYKELESQKILLLAEFEQDIYEKFILPRLRSVDAHDILNKIRK